MFVLSLEITGEYVPGCLVDRFDRPYPVAFAIGVIIAARALYLAEVFGYELIWTYDAPVIAANSAQNEINAFTAGSASDDHSTSPRGANLVHHQRPFRLHNIPLLAPQKIAARVEFYPTSPLGDKSKCARSAMT